MSSSKSANYPWLSTVNAANFVSMRPCLNKDNLERSIKDYKIWRKQMICLLEGQDLLGFIDGQIPPPEESMDEQKLWRRTDQHITGWILGSISGTDVLDAVVGLESSREVWLELEKIFKEDNNEIQTGRERDEDGNMGDKSESSTKATARGAEEGEIERKEGEIQNFAVEDKDGPEGSEPQTSNDVPQQNNNGKDLHWYMPLYRAAVRGDWEEAKKFLDKDPDAITTTIHKTYLRTILQVAVERGKSNDFVRKLLEYPMPSETVLRKNIWGYTALHLAAVVGNKDVAEMLVNKNPDLLYTTNNLNSLPVHLAALFGHKDTLEYLISISKKDVDHNSPFVGKLGASLLTYSVSTEFIDVALELVRQYPDIAALKDAHGTHALEVIAEKAHMFPSGERFNWWQNWVYSRIPLTSLRIPKITNDIENPSSDDQVKKNFDWFQIFTFLVPGAKSIQNKKIMHQEALDLVKFLCRALESLPYDDIADVYITAMFKAIHKGIYEVVEVITEMFPEAVHDQEFNTGCTIFHVAARERAEKIFNLFSHRNYQKQQFMLFPNKSGNNIMHMCGELAPPYKLNLVSGAALQMQRELQWFKEIEKFISPSHRTTTNNAGKSPQMLFTEKHQELKSQGEKWMKDTATSCTVAAALIVTVVFAAAFTVPGGVNSDSGVPIFLKETSFIIFAISDSISMFTSTTSLLMFLSILTSRYAEQDFLYVLPKRLCIGLFTLFTSIIFMMVAFTAAIHIIVKAKSSLFLIPMAALACLPVTSFVLLQFPLLIDVMNSTYGPGIFSKKSN